MALSQTADMLRWAAALLRQPSPETPQDVLLAPCRWCGYNGAGYWQKDTHAATCPWWKVSGRVSRMAVLRDHPTECKPLLAPELAPINHVAYVRDCLADPAVWPRLERPVLQALINEIDRLERGTGHEPTR